MTVMDANVSPLLASGEKHVFSARLLAPNLGFVRDVYGAATLREVYRQWGIEPDVAEDMERWITYEDMLRCNRAIVRATGDREVMYKAGLHHAVTTEFGSWFYIVKLLASPREAYARLPVMSQSMSAISHFEIVDLEQSTARVRFHLSPEYEDDPIIDDKRRGTLAAIPMLFDLPPARVVEETCVHRGDACCTYHISWEQPGRDPTGVAYKVVLPSLVLGLIGLTVGWLVSGLGLGLGAAAFLGVSTALVLVLGRSLSHRLRLAMDRVYVQESQINALEQEVGDNRSQTQRLDNLRKIGDVLQEADSEIGLLRTATQMVKSHLGFDRVICWSLHEGRLLPVAGAGLSEDLRLRLHEAWLPARPHLAGRSPDLPLFGLLLEDLRTARVLDLDAFHADLSERGRALFSMLMPSPFVAVPIPLEGQGVGLLVAEHATHPTELDATLVEQVARQVGLSLRHIRLLQAERAARSQLQVALELERKTSLYLHTAGYGDARSGSDDTARVTPQIATMAVLSVDIVGFSTTSTRLTEHQALDLLNTFLVHAEAIVQTEGGIIDKRLGDGVLAVFQDPTAVERAVSAARGLHFRVRSLDSQLAECGLPPIRLRTTLSHGPVVAGTLGTQLRHEYTVVGRVVSLARQLQVLAGQGQILLTTDALSAWDEPRGVGPQEQAAVCGFPEPVAFHRLVIR